MTTIEMFAELTPVEFAAQVELKRSLLIEIQQAKFPDALPAAKPWYRIYPGIQLPMWAIRAAPHEQLLVHLFLAAVRRRSRPGDMAVLLRAIAGEFGPTIAADEMAQRRLPRLRAQGLEPREKNKKWKPPRKPRSCRKKVVGI